MINWYDCKKEPPPKQIYILTCDFQDGFCDVRIYESEIRYSDKEYGIWMSAGGDGYCGNDKYNDYDFTHWAYIDLPTS
ncbi:MAG: hypothetical protein GY853_02400 [PVC group bacterium]|nr:hypothetical protein [PVC group bacterium]